MRNPTTVLLPELEFFRDFCDDWEEIKKTEKTHQKRKGPFDGIPKSLPTLLKAHKMLQILKKAKQLPSLPKAPLFSSEKELGEHLLSTIVGAQESGFNIEEALAAALLKLKETTPEK